MNADQATKKQLQEHDLTVTQGRPLTIERDEQNQILLIINFRLVVRIKEEEIHPEATRPRQLSS
ncbi:MAG: hypothetical protein DMG97_10175 [Acidobacteria bacterium]|nr:MAG: hypothetical protein DMG96_27355 [Acidobacteriota bacterium]PYV73870.1 MAG: hypothetical protein DMG97_10175 [Acidobacteriota bacterium]